jgi:two-component system, chemotaxis family, chemotaxis protein CheY
VGFRTFRYSVYFAACEVFVRALVVDDSRVSRRILSRILGKLGFEVVEANNGLEGLARLKEMNQTAHVVMVDWNMPVMNGIDLVRAVRAQPIYAKLKIVVITTNSELHDVVVALEAGADEYIMKPFTQDIVHGKLALLGLLS